MRYNVYFVECYKDSLLWFIILRLLSHHRGEEQVKKDDKYELKSAVNIPVTKPTSEAKWV